jgi:hypothetical protein
MLIGRISPARYTVCMINLILTLSLANLQPAPAQTAQFQPCVWPRTCVSAPAAVETAQFRPCVWPNKCRTEQPVLVIAPAVAQFEACVWPKKCVAEKA